MSDEKKKRDADPCQVHFTDVDTASHGIARKEGQQTVSLITGRNQGCAAISLIESLLSGSLLGWAGQGRQRAMPMSEDGAARRTGNVAPLRGRTERRA